MNADDMVQLVVAGRSQKALRAARATHVDLKSEMSAWGLRASGGNALRRQV